MNGWTQRVMEQGDSPALLRTRFAILGCFALGTLGFAGTAHGAGQYLKVDYPASTAADELQVPVTYTLWIPDGVPRLRAIIVHQHGAGTTASIEGSTAPYDLHWQALATKWDCALLGPSYHVSNEKIDLSPGGSEVTVNSVGLASQLSQPKEPSPQSQPGQVAPWSDRYRFEGTISRQVLEDYLDRSVTMAYLLVTGKPEGNREYLYRDDDVRLIQNIGAKFIGRAIYRWNGESRLNDPNFWTDAKALIEKVHAFDPDVIFQGCLFETISREVNRVKIPSWVFTEFGLAVEDRTFSYEAMLNKDGKLVNHWGRASVPDVTRLETQLWFCYLAGSYIDLGCEALHLGQVGLIGMADPGLREWARVVARIRAYAKTHARRKLVLLDAHVPTGGMLVEGVSLLDFNSFPMRIKAIPKKPHEAELQVGHLDAIYKRSKGCISPSGWSCQSLPYLVEFDNFGRSRTPNVADTTAIFVWGWDEISWFSLQDEEYRNKWLVYAYNWIKETDPNGHLEMPVSRMISCPNETLGSYRANTRSPNCLIGYSQEETIKKIWNGSLRQAGD